MSRRGNAFLTSYPRRLAQLFSTLLELYKAGVLDPMRGRDLRTATSLTSKPLP